MEGFYPLGVVIILLVLLGVSTGGTIWRLRDNYKRTGNFFKRDKNGRIK